MNIIKISTFTITKKRFLHQHHQAVLESTRTGCMECSRMRKIYITTTNSNSSTCMFYRLGRMLLLRARTGFLMSIHSYNSKHRPSARGGSHPSLEEEGKLKANSYFHRVWLLPPTRRRGAEGVLEVCLSCLQLRSAGKHQPGMLPSSAGLVRLLGCQTRHMLLIWMIQDKGANS